MNRNLLRGMTLAGLTCLFPAIGQTQEWVAGPPVNCTITRPRPVVSTQFQTQQVTTYCDVAETQMTQRQVVENVPVTTCQNVTRDEGGYQMVWVPKPVTRQVAQTTMQQQVKTVSVPVQVVRRVPQVSTQVVPVQTVQYVNETVPVQATAMASTCDTCGSNRRAFRSGVMAPQFGFAPQPAYMAASPIFAAPQMGYVPPQYPSAPSTTAMIPSMPAITVPSYKPAMGPTPLSPSTNGLSQSAPSRSAANTYETVPARGVPAPRDEAVVPARKTSKFTGVPSAASVWQAQGGISR